MRVKAPPRESVLPPSLGVKPKARNGGGHYSKVMTHLRYGVRFNKHWVDHDFQLVKIMTPENAYSLLFVNRKQAVHHRAEYRRITGEFNMGLKEVVISFEHVPVVRTR